MFAALWICRLLHYTAAMLAFGAAAFVWGLAPSGLAATLAPPVRRIIRLAALVLVVTAAVWLLLESGLMGDGWDTVADPTTIGAVLWDTSFGRAWQLHGVLSLCLLLAALPMFRSGWPVCLAAALALASLALVGHAAMQSAPAGWLHRANLAVHLLAGGFWLGGLLPLIGTIRLASDPDCRGEAIVALRRFSAIGHAAVAAVVTTGVVNTALIVGAEVFAQASLYRTLLTAKVAIVALMIGLAVVNRYWIVPSLRLHPEAARRLIGNSLAELGLGAAAIALVSVFGLLDPHV